MVYAVWPAENWLGSSMNHIQGWMTDWECCRLAWERGCLHNTCPLSLHPPDGITRKTTQRAGRTTRSLSRYRLPTSSLTPLISEKWVWEEQETDGQSSQGKITPINHPCILGLLSEISEKMIHIHMWAYKHITGEMNEATLLQQMCLYWHLSNSRDSYQYVVSCNVFPLMSGGKIAFFCVLASSGRRGGFTQPFPPILRGKL